MNKKLKNLEKNRENATVLYCFAACHVDLTRNFQNSKKIVKTQRFCAVLLCVTLIRREIFSKFAESVLSYEPFEVILLLSVLYISANLYCTCLSACFMLA